MQLSKLVIGVSLMLVSWASPAAAQVAFPDSPSALVAMGNADGFVTNLQQRAYVFKAWEFALSRESTLAQKPYTTAFQSWFASKLNGDGRATQIFATQFAATGNTKSIDVYLLMGQSNMVGLTESGGYNGPDPEIRAAIQAATPDRAVVTLNCAFSASFIGWWTPETISFSDFAKKLRHNLARECVEAARNVRNKSGKRGRIKGIFFYQGESEVALATQFNSPNPIDTWAQHYHDIVDFFRDEFGDIPAVHAQLASSGNTDPLAQQYWTRMQQAQAAALNGMTRAKWIVTKDLQTHDGLHLNDASQAVAGQRFATAMLSLR